MSAGFTHRQDDRTRLSAARLSASRRFAALAIGVLVTVTAGCKGSEQRDGDFVRVAVVGGLTRTGLWQELESQFEDQTGIDVQLVATGPKRIVLDAVHEGGVDLVTLHSSDAIANLVSTGVAEELTPWAMNDLVIVGPPDDPAQIHGLGAVAALSKLGERGAPLVWPRGVGPQEVLHSIAERGGFEIDDRFDVRLAGADRHRILEEAASVGAYSIVGRIPFESGKIPRANMEIHVSGDALLRRSYLLAIIRPEHDPHARVVQARRLSAFLRSRSAQQFIEGFHSPMMADGKPTFLPVAE